MNKVYLVGAGPGDPGLITWKGRKLLAIADSILYDNLANEHLLDLAPKTCERIYVGKKKSVHAFPQEEICAMMIDRVRRGLTVVRLKGGDPFVFGRGGEELEALVEAGVAYDASLMQMAEVDYQIMSKTNLILGSEESPPGGGYPQTYPQ